VMSSATANATQDRRPRKMLPVAQSRHVTSPPVRVIVFETAGAFVGQMSVRRAVARDVQWRCPRAIVLLRALHRNSVDAGAMCRPGTRVGSGVTPLAGGKPPMRRRGETPRNGYQPARVCAAARALAQVVPQ
jgi:hypothetical protein